MQKRPKHLKTGDRIAIVSLSRGLLGMPFCKHELDIGLRRLKTFGLEPVLMPNALRSLDDLAAHPEARAADLKQAFGDDSIRAILCAIGGDDTYRTIPYLMDDPAFIEAVRQNPKIFTGFSDTTFNHLMLNRLGLSTFYGPCFMVDLAELDTEMLPYTKASFEQFFRSDPAFAIPSSPIWYGDRESYGADQVGVPRDAHPETHGYETLNGSGTITGKLYGGCIESLYDAMTGERYGDEPKVMEAYHIFPTEAEWAEKLLFLETSECASSPERLETMLMAFKVRGILRLVQGVLVGKPIDEKHYEAYKAVYRKVFSDLDTPVLYNLNFGHSVPRCILPYDATTQVDFDRKTVTVLTPMTEPAD